MEFVEQRAVIKFMYLKGMKGSEIFKEMKNVLGEYAPSYATVKNWMAEFKRGRMNIQDVHRSGRPKSVTTEEIINKIHEMVLNDRQLKLSDIAFAVGISKERVFNILTKKLRMRKISAQWVAVEVV